MILVAIGANLPGPDGRTPLQTCRAAVQLLAELPGLRPHSMSRWFETRPVPRSDQPDYVNGVARLERIPDSPVDPAALLASLHAIEALFGRRRGETNAA